MTRLIQANHIFHRTKEGTEEPNAENYLKKVAKLLKLNIEDICYNDIRQKFKIRHSQGLDAITLILKNEHFQTHSDTT